LFNSVEEAFITRGTPEFRRTNLAMFAAGFATFALMYCVQPLLPVFAQEFRVSPVQASLALSLTTFTLALSLLVASAISETIGRKPVMVASILATAALTIASAFAPDWGLFLILRALIGFVLSGLPAVAMAYVAEEMHPKSVGLAMGLYVGGSGFGGMCGRLLTGILADHFGWRAAVAMIGAVGLVTGLLFLASLPASKHFERRIFSVGALFGGYAAHLRDGTLRLLFADAFLIMGGFVAVYNYITFRLLAPPFALSQTEVGLVFTVYLVGVASSAWIGSLAGRLGRQIVLPVAIAIELAGALITLSGILWLVIFGIALVTFGFFASHSVASAWVGARARAAKAQAAALYLFLYYLGSSVAGSAGGWFWAADGWPGVVAMITVLLAIGVFLSLILRWSTKEKMAF
jgi:YNFM family putative membrane transporter